MNSSKKMCAAVGFPPPLLGAVPQRLPILEDAPGWIALEKPFGVGTRAHPWDDGVPDLDQALNVQLQAGKPELKRLGPRLFASIYYLDPQVAGIALFAKNHEVRADLRNRFGSGEGTFRFRFVAGAAPGEAEAFVMDAPLLPHRTKPKMIPSTAKGKKCRTVFRQLGRAGNWAYWEACCGFFRAHQVRAHAAVAGIPVLGDQLYSGPPVPMLGELLSQRKRRTGKDKPAFPDLPLRLCGVELPSEESVLQIASPPDKPFELLLKRLQLNEAKDSAPAE
ncbi:MAG: hypothetical protein ACLFU4_00455 [Opitutales bacterium]